MKNKILSAAFAVIAVCLLTSCLGKDSKGLEQTYSINKFVNAFDGTDFVSYDVSYKYTLYYESNTARMEITGLKLPDGKTYSTLVLEDLKFNANSSGWLVLSGNGIKAEGLSSYVPDLVFDTFEFQIHDNFLQNNTGTYNTPYANVTYRVAGYTVRSMPSLMILQGTTTVKSQMGGEFTYNDAMYQISIDMEKSVGAVSIQGAKFAEKMPAMNMKFKDIPVSVDPSGWFILRSDSLVPMIVGSDNKETPYPNYPISDLTLALNPASGMNFNFTCTLISEQEVDGEKVTTEMPFQVSVTAHLQNPK